MQCFTTNNSNFIKNSLTMNIFYWLLLLIVTNKSQSINNQQYETKSGINIL